MKRFIKIFLLSILIAGFTFYFLSRPKLSPAIQIFPGITYSAEKIKSRYADETFLAVTATVDLTNNNLQIIQPAPYQVPEKPKAHFKLQFADFILEEKNLDIIINTTPFHGEIDNSKTHEILSGFRGNKTDFTDWQGYPGRSVWSTEPIVTNGKATHIPTHSNLLWLDANNKAFISHITGNDLRSSLEHQKPYSIQNAFGYEVIHVKNKKPQPIFLRPEFQKDRIRKRTFIGINKASNQLFLMAFENITTRDMIDYAITKGVEIGGQLDSGNSTSLLFGKRVTHIFPHSGIRGLRPIAGYLGIRIKDHK